MYNAFAAARSENAHPNTLPIADARTSNNYFSHAGGASRCINTSETHDVANGNDLGPLEATRELPCLPAFPADNRAVKRDMPHTPRTAEHFSRLATL